MYINPKGKVSLKISENFTRTADAQNQTVQRTLRRISNRSGLDVQFKPGGGALEFKVGYAFNIDYYSDFQTPF